ncbi:MAG: Sir2 family NAD-dependent protein deacetylase [Chloroherpetonaceae bacterium]|nr:Sir2 family NAD-dependent protein deacetylase [Chloroherpetonaceae bacterium]
MSNKTILILFSGAGLSAESGIPTFRDSNGLWENHRIEDVASPEGWKRNPNLVLDFYSRRFEKLQNVKPNRAHYAIAELQEKYEVINITQNIDNLLEQAGSKTVWHLHGELTKAKCEWHYEIFGFNPHFRCTFKKEISSPDEYEKECPLCGGKLRPDVVWFGEAVDMKTGELEKLKESASIFIGVGTSAQVYPAAGLISYFSNLPQKFFIDKNPAFESLRGFEVLQGLASEMLPKLANELLDRSNLSRT